jgi:uncharacterized protein YbjT (DUF2867 family)
MSVLVSGATGFIGPLIRRLVARGESVVGMDVNPGAAAFGDVPIGAPVTRGDVTQFEDVMRTVLDVKPDRLINLAYGLGAGEGSVANITILRRRSPRPWAPSPRHKMPESDTGRPGAVGTAHTKPSARVENAGPADATESAQGTSAVHV